MIVTADRPRKVYLDLSHVTLALRETPEPEGLVEKRVVDVTRLLNFAFGNSSEATISDEFDFLFDVNESIFTDAHRVVSGNPGSPELRQLAERFSPDLFTNVASDMLRLPESPDPAVAGEFI